MTNSNTNNKKSWFANAHFRVGVVSSPSEKNGKSLLSDQRLISISNENRGKMFKDIQRKGDKAVLQYGQKFDFPEQKTLLVDKETINAAADKISEPLKQAINLARQNIEKFHLSQQEEIKKVETSPGVVCWRESRPIERVGIYVPGGSAPLFSTVLMLTVPAKIAGCSEIVLCTPPDKNGNIHPAILYTANLVGVTRIVAAGGIQAIRQ